jgi:hypothetical protein
MYIREYIYKKKKKTNGQTCSHWLVVKYRIKWHIDTNKKKRKDKENHTRNVSRLVIVNTELTFVDVGVEVLLFPIRLSIVNEFFNFWWWGIIGIVGGGGGKSCNGGGNNGKHRFVDDDVGINGNGMGGNDGGGPVGGTSPWWKHAEWWWWWWWFIRLKRLRRRKNEPLSNIFSLAGSKVQ